MDVISPATEQVIGSIPAATAPDVDHAVAAASATVKAGTWTKSSGAYRAGFLKKIAEKVCIVSKTTTLIVLPPSC